ncbi:MAG: YitT family protein [Clostridia bacterium]|nr:YitT family protein [Clostridia bacterium]
MKGLKGYIILIVGTFFMGLGIALTKCSELGVSTISSVPNVLSIRFTFMTLGTWSAVFNLLMILVQVLLLGKEFKPSYLLQIPLSVIFGWFADFGVWIFSYIPVNMYFIKIVLSVAGVVLLGFGISLTAVSGIVMNPAEALVKVIADKLGKDFGNAKILFDIVFVAMATILSLVFFNFRIVGVREGTIIAMFGTGICVKCFMKLFKRRNYGA